MMISAVVATVAVLAALAVVADVVHVDVVVAISLLQQAPNRKLNRKT